MYHLTISTSTAGKVLRTDAPVGAPEALRNWFAEEVTGYGVTCQDNAGVRVTKAQLRTAAQRTYAA